MRRLASKRVLAALFLGLSATSAQAGKEDDTFVWSTHTEINVPFVWWDNLIELAAIMHHTFDTLVYRDPETMEYKPLLAESWTRIDDLTLEFTLRTDVKYHDGSDFDADDVVESITRLTDPASRVLNASMINWIDSVEKIDDHTVRIRTTEPFAPALEYLSGTRMGIPSAGSWQAAPTSASGEPDYARMPVVGTGPYRLVGFVPGQEIRLERNEDYFDGPKGRPDIGTVIFRTISDQETRVAELMVGNIDWIADIPIDTVEALEAMPNLTVQNGPDMRVSYLAMEATGRGGDSPVTDVRVRQAIAHAIDRQAIVDNLIGEPATVVNAGCFPAQVGCPVDLPPYEYDPEKARSLLAEAGYPDGFDITIDAFRDRHLLEAIVGYLREVGISANVNMLQWAAMRGRMENGTGQVFQTNWASAGLNDVSAMASVLLKMTPDDTCQDPEVKALLDQADGSLDTDERAGLYRQALGRVQETACWVPLYTHSRIYAYNADAEFFPTADGFPLFFLARWK